MVAWPLTASSWPLGFVFLAAAAPPAFRAGGRGKTFWVRKSNASESWLVAILWRCAAVWLRVFGHCAGCAKLRAGGQNLDSDSETKCATIRLGRVFLVMAPPTLRGMVAWPLTASSWPLGFVFLAAALPSFRAGGRCKTVWV